MSFAPHGMVRSSVDTWSALPATFQWTYCCGIQGYKGNDSRAGDTTAGSAPNVGDHIEFGGRRR